MLFCTLWLCAAVGFGTIYDRVKANVEAYIMPDLGYPEPDWGDFRHVPGSSLDPVITATPDQVWGDIMPGDTGTYCKWSPGTENEGRGKCRTDISWLHSSIGLSKDIFSDPVVNYVLRFFIEGACYRSTQYAYNGVTRYCATWWLDPRTSLKVNVSEICYDMEWPNGKTDALTGAAEVDKLGCAHKAPAGIDHSAAAGTADAGAGGAGATVAAINTTADFVRAGLLNDAGLERWDRHQMWQDCKAFTAAGSAARGVCQEEAIGIALGRDVPTLRAMLDVLKNPDTDCARLFAANGDRQNSTLNPAWCEVDTAGWIVSQMLPQVGLVGTPEAPKSLAPRVTPPPPPPPVRATTAVPSAPDVLDGMRDTGAAAARAAAGPASFAAIVCAVVVSVTMPSIYKTFHV